MDTTPTDLIFTICFEDNLSIRELALRCGLKPNTLMRIVATEARASDQTMKAIENYMRQRGPKRETTL